MGGHEKVRPADHRSKAWRMVGEAALLLLKIAAAAAALIGALKGSGLV